MPSEVDVLYQLDIHRLSCELSDSGPDVTGYSYRHLKFVASCKYETSGRPFEIIVSMRSADKGQCNYADAFRRFIHSIN